MGKAAKSAVAQQAKAQACPPSSLLSSDGGHGATAPLPTLASRCYQELKLASRSFRHSRYPARIILSGSTADLRSLELNQKLSMSTDPFHGRVDTECYGRSYRRKARGQPYR